MDLEIRDAVLQENCVYIKKWLAKNDANLMDEEGSTLLHFGCSQNKPKVVKMLLKKGASVNTKDKKGWTPLHCAAYDKHLNICQLLLKYNADPTIQNTSQTTATFYVVRCKEEGPLLGQVLGECFRKGATPNDRNIHSETLLMVTCLHGCATTVEFLIHNGAELNAQNTRKETCLFYSIRGRNIGTLNVLLKYHIDVNLPSIDNATAINEAKHTQWDEGLSTLSQYIQDNTPTMEIEIESIPPRFPKFHQGLTFQNANSIISFGGAITAVQYSNQLYSFDLKERTWKVIQANEDVPNVPPVPYRPPVPRRSFNNDLHNNNNANNNANTNNTPNNNLVNNLINTLNSNANNSNNNASASNSPISPRSINNNNSNNNVSATNSPPLTPSIHSPRNSLNTSGGNSSSNKPPQMSGHSIITYNNILYLLGGRNSFQTFADCYSFNFNTSSWNIQSNMKFSNPICYHSSVLYGDKIITFGGSQSKGALPLNNSVNIFNFTSNSSYNITPDNSPCPRMQHSCSIVDHNMYVFGGTALDSVLNDLYVLDCFTFTWSKPATRGKVPSPRFGHSSCHYDNKMYIFGGINEKGQLLSDFFEFNPQTLEWTEIILTLSSQRSGHSLITDGRDLYVVGGGLTTNNLLRINIKLLLSPPSKFTPLSPDLKKKSDDRDGLTSSSSGIKKRFSSYDISSTFRKGSKDESPSSRESTHNMGTIRKSNSGRPQKKKKSTENISLLVNRIEVLDAYNTHLSDQLSSLISGLEMELAKNEPFDKNGINSIKTILSSLKEVEKDKPSNQWEGSELMLNKVIPSKTSLPHSSSTSITHANNQSLLNSHHTFGSDFDLKKKTIPFPKHHYDILTVPPKRIPKEQPAYPKSDDQLDKEVRNRNLVLNEILTTETDYVRDLAVIIGLFLRPLQNEYADIIGVYEIKNLFKNVEQLWDVNNDLLSALLEEEKKPEKNQQIGKIFSDFVSRLSIYNIYCANQVTSGETLEKLLKENSRFKDFVDEVSSIEESNNQDINSYLIKPFQRITRYPLLLKELAKMTPKGWGEDLPFIENATKAIDVVVKGANETKRVNDKMLKVLDLQNKLDRDAANPMLSSLHKFEYIVDFPVKDINVKNQKSTKCLLYLFEEMILVAQPKGQKFVKRYLFQTPSISLHTDFKPTSKIKFPIEIQFKDERFVFDCLTGANHTELLTSLTELLKEFKD